MELRHLRYFLVTAEEMHFTRAAARLNINQPPLSQQIKDLETELGVQLFYRIGRRIELSEAGRCFLRDTRNILEMVELAKATAQQIGRGEKGAVRIGFTGSACCHALVPFTINEFRSSYPNVDLSLNEGSTSNLLERLREGHLDVAFLRPKPNDLTGLCAQIVAEECVLAALPAQHRLAGNASLRLSDLSGDSLVIPTRTVEPLSHETILSACHMADFEPVALREVPQAASIINLVATGYGVALIPQSMCQMKPAGVVYLPVEGFAPRITLSVAWRRENMSLATGHFVASVLDGCATAAILERAGSSRSKKQDVRRT